MILYSPLPSVMAVRTFSINAPLAASTLTPATGTPAASRTTPTMLLRDCCADAGAESTNAQTKKMTDFTARLAPTPRRTRIDLPPPPLFHAGESLDPVKNDVAPCRPTKGMRQKRTS